MAFSKAILLILSALLISTVSCNHENHDHHDHNNNNQHKGLLWLTILNSLGVTVENKADEISVTEANSDRTQSFKEHYTPKTTLDVEATEESNTPVLQNGFENGYAEYSANVGIIVGITMACITGLFFVAVFCYIIYACCYATRQRRTTLGQIISRPALVHAPPEDQQFAYQQAPPHYEEYIKSDPVTQQWAPQMDQNFQYSPMGQPAQYTPMGLQTQYSPNSAHNSTAALHELPKY